MALSLPSPSRRRLFGEQSLNHAPTSPQPTSRNAVQLAKSESTKQVLAPIYKELSPRSRSKGLKPRKSILKTSTSVRNEGGDENEDFTFNYGMFAKKSEEDTMDTMGLPRRVSFARNMAVRWFEKGDKEGRPPADPSIYDPLPLPNGQRPYNAGHVRRPSIPLTATIRELTATPEPPSNVGEESMDVETASEASSEEDEDDQRGEAGQVQFGKFEGQGGQRFSLGRPSAAGRMSMANEDEQDMDVTQVIYGGIRSRASLAQSDGDESIVSSEGVSRTDDERTMDFTVAIGGVLPVAAPEGAKRSRRSLGYALPESPNSAAQRLRPGEAMEGELDLDAQVEMDETVAIGGIVREDDSLSSVESDDTAAMANKERTMTFSFNPSLQQDQTEAMGMDMTVAIGGIVGVAPVSPAWPGHEAATPSFARPTVASAQKSKTTEKRNVFAPSPSPVKSTTPVTKTPMGMTAAGDVAKRLSFGSVTSSGGRKRALSTGSEGEEAAESATKRARPVAVEGVFASTSTTTTTSTTMTTLAVAEPSASVRASPRKSVGRMAPSPRPAKSPRKSLAVPVPYTTTPIKSPMLRRALGMSTTPAEDRAMKAAAEGPMDTEEMPAIKLSAFLEMAGVGFMEGLPGLQKPRSSIAKGLLSSINGEREIPLYEYTAAQVHSVLRHMYSWAANKMREDIQSLRASLLAEEEECDARNPPVIKEYLASTDEIKALFEMTFKSFKTNTQLKVRGRWYDWKTGLFERVRPEVESVWQGVQEDSEHLTALETVADALLPELESRHAALQAELVKERELARELESCNQDDLLNLRQGVAESTAELNSFAADLKELTCQLDKLQTNLEDLQAQKAEATAAIMRARSRCDQYTKSDIFRLQEEYAGLQSLHLCKVVAVKENIVSLCFDNEVELSVPCTRFVPDLKSAVVRLLPAATTDSSKAKASGDGEDTRLLFATFEKAIETLVLTGSYSTLPSLVQDVSKFWVAVQRMRQEFRHAALHYPVSYSTGPGATGPTTRAIAKIMLPGMRSKVELAFEVDADVLDRWPAAVGSVGVSAHVVYGDAEAEDVVSVAHAAMEIETEPGKIGFLSRACLEVSRSFAA